MPLTARCASLRANEKLYIGRAFRSILCRNAAPVLDFMFLPRTADSVASEEPVADWEPPSVVCTSCIMPSDVRGKRFLSWPPWRRWACDGLFHFSINSTVILTPDLIRGKDDNALLKWNWNYFFFNAVATASIAGSRPARYASIVHGAALSGSNDATAIGRLTTCLWQSLNARQPF